MKNLILVFSIVSTFFAVSLSAQTPTPKPTPDAEKFKNDPEYKKNWEEYEKKLAEVEVKNKKIAETNAKVMVLFEEANKAYQDKKYELAIKKYREAEVLDDYWGMIAVILTNKSIALRIVGVEKYNKEVNSRQILSLSSQTYFAEAVDSLEKALKILEENKNSIELDKQESFNRYKFNATRELAESYRLFLLNDICETPKAIKAYQDYISLEKDEILKAKAEKDLSKIRNKTYICGS